MATKPKPVPVPDPVAEPSTPEPAARGLFAPLTLGDVIDVACLSREACRRLPSEEDIEKACRSEHARPLIIEGSRLLRYMAGEAGQGDPDEIHAALIRFVQVDGLLSVVGQVTEKSCIGEAEAEKQECKKKCEENTSKKFCGCFWNSFLSKTNCFVGGVNGIPGIG